MLNKIIIVLLMLVCGNLSLETNKQDAPICIGFQSMFYDPTCDIGGLGCNAEGLFLCRFCGFQPYYDCPSSTIKITTPTATTTTSSLSNNCDGNDGKDG
jgi:hypothetical protein